MNFDELVMDSALRDPTPSNDVVTLPCGIVLTPPDGEPELVREVTLQELTGEDEDILGSDMPFHAKMDRLLSRSIIAVGEISNPHHISQIVPRMLDADRMAVFFGMRRVSLGHQYPFSDRCPSCEKDSWHNYDLRTLKVIPMPEPLKREREVALPSGAVAVIRCLNGKDEERRAHYKDSLQPLTLQIFLRTIRINGEDATPENVRALSMKDRAYLRGAFVAMDGALETLVTLTCEKCQHKYKRNLDPSHPGFFSPSEASLIWKRRSSI